MHFNTMTLMLVSALATGLMATPIQEQDAVTDWVEHSREIGKTGGHLIYFGPRNGTETPESQEEGNTLQQRSCGYSSKEPNIPKSPRQICYQGDSGKNTFCCVSWHNAITGLKKKDLAPYADKILKTCTQNAISGKTSDVHVHHKCTDVCLSNRGTHC
ncbi:hypothetical protein N7537_011736 [Penicillium hordei]|uniref:WD-like domain-containing protein n=1 Tax=Penicillium hordei TaxID=40994 RepID=A0AAD6DMD0_9EURO|nr:uncharacterized protein N7537_011736 [Penicillium hordei]KAJ5589058.1 hypothetical protein N7537_011736 [Penicillium hordei]